MKTTTNFENALVDGPKYKVVKLNRHGAAESIGIMQATYGRKGDTGCYHYEAVIRAFNSYGKQVPYDANLREEGIKARARTAADYLDELGVFIYEIKNGTLSITGLKEWI